MDPRCLSAFEDEMSKIAGLRELWHRVVDFFRPQDDRAQRRADRFLSPDADSARWDRLPRYARDQKFVDSVARSPLADAKLKLHVQSMHDLSHGAPVAKIYSESSPGKSYEIRKLPAGALGCQCGDWRYKGSVTTGYECKHIRAYRDGKTRVA